MLLKSPKLPSQARLQRSEKRSRQHQTDRTNSRGPAQLPSLAEASLVCRPLGRWSVIVADADVIVYESSPSVGGKLRLNEIEGLSLDAGAESMLAVRPEAIALTKAVGLGSSIVNPATTSAAVYSRGELRPCRLG